MSKTLTNEQITQLANQHAIDPASLKAVIEVECRGNGFDKHGKPVILFERHVFYQRLTKMRWFTHRNRLYDTHPSLCNPNWGGYNSHGGNQQLRLEIASGLVDSPLCQAAAQESCSWGLGQVMGYHWQSLGYGSIDEFVAQMERGEYEQMDAMIRFIKVNGLVGYLNSQNWQGFAYRYNGKAYKRNRYDSKLAKAYQRHVQMMA